MFLFSILIGVYTYIIFFLGIAGLLYQNIIIWITIGFWGTAFYFTNKSLILSIRNIKKLSKIRNKLFLIFLFVFLAQAFVNLIGTLGPELAFDALWYHLTLPKIWLTSHRIFFIPGGLLYYSPMPKLAEMLFISGLAFGSELISKLIHYSFGLLTCLAIYKLSRKFFNSLISFVAVLIFYSNLVVGWESITAYIDLTRTLFEIMALWGFINWQSWEKKKWLFISAIMLGLGITTKLLSVGSLIIFSILIFYKALENYRLNQDAAIRSFFVYWIIAIAIPLPWLIFAYIHTGNPVYPFFTQTYQISPEPFSLVGFFNETWNIFTHSPDPLSPIYIMFFPLIIYVFPKLKKKLKIIALYSLASIFTWYFTPRTGGGRFMLAYLPAFSIVCAAVINFFIGSKKRFTTILPKFLILLVILVSLASMVYRFAANAKYIPVILGNKSKGEFLTNHLNFSFGDFYDTDGYFEKKIKQADKVLLLGFHNLYYVNFPFVDSSWILEGERFNYIALQGTKLPTQFNNWNLIYNNSKSHVQLYSLEGGKWEYWKY